MAKFLKDIIGETYVMETSAHPNTQGTHSRSEDEERFVAKHKPSRFDNMYTTGEHAADYDKVFGAGNIDMANRKDHGYTGSPTPTGPLQEPKPGEDAAVYEDVQLDEAENETLQPHLPTEVEFKHPETGEVRPGTVRHSVHNGGMHTGFEVEDHKTRQPNQAGEMHIVPKGHVRHAPGYAVDVKAAAMSPDPRFD